MQVTLKTAGAALDHVLTRTRSRVVGFIPEPLLRWARRVRWKLKEVLASKRHGPLPPLPEVPRTSTRLLVGPANFAGQGWWWGRAAETVSGVSTVVSTVQGGTFNFPTDQAIDADLYRDPRWQERQRSYVASNFTHVLIEAVRPVLGLRSTFVEDAIENVRVLRSAGISVAMVAHGSDVRLPSRHAAREMYSPFKVESEYVAKLERFANRAGAAMASFDGPKFVSTPDLLIDVPDATWLPVVVNPQRWQNSTTPLKRRRPLILHAPSNPHLKGTAEIESVVFGLVDRGVADYRRVEGVANDELPALFAEADIVIDQLLMGLYGVLACEAMAAGRVVISYVGDYVRDQVFRNVRLEVPIIESPPGLLGDVLQSVIDDTEGSRERAAAGPGYVRAIHDGTRSADVLRPWLTN